MPTFTPVSYFKNAVYDVTSGVSIASGVLAGYSQLLKFGENFDIDTGGFEDIWDGGATWVAPTQARVHAMVSGSADDAAAGTGARTVRVIGLDANYVTQAETVTLNGVTPVNTTGSYVIIHRMYVITAGSGGVNAGNITATAATDTTVTAQITTGKNQTLMAIYPVPASKTAYMSNYYADVLRAVTAAVDIELIVKPFGEVFQVKHTLSVNSGGMNYFNHYFGTPLVITEKSIIKIRAQTSANNTVVSAGFDMVMIDD
jgi:hypothetical protein